MKPAPRLPALFRAHGCLSRRAPLATRQSLYGISPKTLCRLHSLYRLHRLYVYTGWTQKSKMRVQTAELIMAKNRLNLILVQKRASEFFWVQPAELNFWKIIECSRLNSNVLHNERTADTPRRNSNFVVQDFMNLQDNHGRNQCSSTKKIWDFPQRKLRFS